MTEQISSFRRERFVAGVFYVLIAGLCLLPGANLLFIWLLPVPLIVFHVSRLRWPTPFMALVATGCLLVSGFNLTALLIGLAVYFLSWAMGDALAQMESPYAPLITGTFVFIMLELVILALTRWSGVDLFTALSNQFAQTLSSNSTMLGVNQGALSQFESQEMGTIRLMFPAILCVMAFLAAAVNLLLARLVLRRRIASAPLLRNWRLPYSVVAVYFITMAFVLFGWLRTSPLLWQAMNSGMFLSGFLLGIQGLALVWRRLYQRQLAYVWLTILIILSAFIGNLFVLFGLIDSMLRARRA